MRRSRFTRFESPFFWSIGRNVRSNCATILMLLICIVVVHRVLYNVASSSGVRVHSVIFLSHMLVWPSRCQSSNVIERSLNRALVVFITSFRFLFRSEYSVFCSSAKFLTLLVALCFIITKKQIRLLSRFGIEAACLLNVELLFACKLSKRLSVWSRDSSYLTRTALQPK